MLEDAQRTLGALKAIDTKKKVLQRALHSGRLIASWLDIICRAWCGTWIYFLPPLHHVRPSACRSSLSFGILRPSFQYQGQQRQHWLEMNKIYDIVEEHSVGEPTRYASDAVPTHRPTTTTSKPALVPIPTGLSLHTSTIPAPGEAGLDCQDRDWELVLIALTRSGLPGLSQARALVYQCYWLCY